MAIGPVSTFDTFNRSLDGDWYRTDNQEVSANSQAWLGTSNQYWDVDLTSGVGQIDVFSGFPNYDVAWIDLASYQIPYTNGQQVLVKVNWSSTAATDFGPAIYVIDADNYFYASIRQNQQKIGIKQIKNGVAADWGSVSVPLSANTDYWVRLEQNLMTFSVKIWRAAVHEPSSWTYTTTVGGFSGFSGGGFCRNWGMAARNTSSNYTVNIDNFYAWSFAEDDQVPAVTETFARIRNDGWGKTDSGHIWEGTVSSNPEFYKLERQGTVTTASGIGGRINTGFIGEQFAYIETYATGDVNAYLEYQTNTGSVNGELYIGLCGDVTNINGELLYTGYGFKILRNATNFTVHTKTSYGGAWSAALGTSTTNAFTAIGSNTPYRIRIAKIGNQLYGRLWTGTTEPSTWNIITVADSTFTTGVPFIAINNLDTTLRNFDFHFYNYGIYVPATTTYTQTGTLSVTATTATTMSFQAQYTNDSDNNNTIAVAYRKSSVSAWTTFGGTVTRDSASSPKKWTGTITGLEPTVSYQIRVTFSDAGSVVGTNPLYVSSTTTTTGVYVLTPVESNVGTSTITITQPYLYDTNNNSTATLFYRTTTTLDESINDTFTDESGTQLQDHTESGTWVRHANSIGSDSAAVWRSQAYYQSVGNLSNNVIYYNNATSFADGTISTSIFANGSKGIAAILGRVSSAAATYYAVSYHREEQLLYLYKFLAGTPTTLKTYYFEMDNGKSFALDFKMEGTSLYVYVDRVQVMNVTDSSIASGYAGIKFVTSSTDIGTFDNLLNFDYFIVSSRVPAGAWTTWGAMTPNYGSKFFTANVTGLTAGQVYEFRPQMADADGVFGAVMASVIVQMRGVQILPSSVTVTPSQTTALIDIPYTQDTNNNANVTIQYKSIFDRHWKTVSPATIRAHRTADPTKYFQAVLSGLRSGLSYEVKTTFDDSDGITEGAPSVIRTTFATQTFLHESEARQKYYLYKVYDEDDKYVTTWEDAEIPEFSFYENGGVSDLRVTLPRKISSILEPNSGVAFQNRIDVWEVDPSSSGFGINMVDNPTFEPDLGGWLPQTGSETNAILGLDYGPGDGSGLKISSTDSTVYRIRSNYIALYPPDQSLRGKYATSNAIPVPIVVMCMARAAGGKMIMDVESYAQDAGVAIGASAELGMTVGNDWQVLRIEYTPPKDARYIRIQFRNEGKGSMYAGNVTVRPKEAMIYRGHIETFTPSIDDDGEKIDIEVLGLVSFLSDDYIDFLQYVENSMQPQNDVDAGKPNKGPADPAKMLRDIIDLARQQNPRCPLYYTDSSIQNTDQQMRYTFRNRQLRGCFDKVRELCPSGWHYYIAPDGCVFLRDSATAPTHKLRVGVEVLKFSAERSIRNLKNYIIVKGRQDEDLSENGTFGSIREVAFDQESINKYGKRVLQINDAQIITPQDAELIAAGRLEEHNHEEQQVACTVMDEKIILRAHNSLRGYNVESFRPGDNVVFFDPISGPSKTYWNQFEWDEGYWNYGQDFQPLTDSVPIKRIQFQGDYVTLELSERQPSSIGDFGRMYRVLQLRSEETGE
jgi:hypothetical protein